MGTFLNAGKYLTLALAILALFLEKQERTDFGLKEVYWLSALSLGFAFGLFLLAHFLYERGKADARREYL